jgi:hypothetical protein
MTCVSVIGYSAARDSWRRNPVRVYVAFDEKRRRRLVKGESPSTKRFPGGTSFDYQGEETERLPGEKLRSAMPEDHAGHIWIGAEDGLYQLASTNSAQKRRSMNNLNSNANRWQAANEKEKE